MLIFPEKPWQDILLTCNLEAVEAAANAGIELMPPEKPTPKPKPLTDEDLNKIRTEIYRLKGIIKILSFAIYFSFKIVMLFFILDYLLNMTNSLPNSSTLAGAAFLGVFVIIFVAPMGILFLINRWARLDSVEE